MVLAKYSIGCEWVGGVAYERSMQFKSRRWFRLSTCFVDGKSRKHCSLSRDVSLGVAVSAAHSHGVVRFIGTRVHRGGVAGWGVLAGVHVHPAATLLAADEAAPVKLALALVHLAHRLGVVAPPTAHDVTSVCAE